MGIVAPTSPTQQPFDMMNWDQNGLVVYSQDLRNTLWNTISELDWNFADLYNYQNGVLGSGLQVSGVSGMTTAVSAGRGRALNGLKVVQLVAAGTTGQPATFNASITNGSGITSGQSRIDVVALKYDFYTYTDSNSENHTVDNTSIKVIQGTAGVSPSIPSLPDSSYVQLATVTVPSGATNIAQCTIDNTQRTSLGTVPAPNSGVPTGTILEFGGTSVPNGYLGLSSDPNTDVIVSRTTYAGLFGVIGTTFGNGTGSGNDFTLPNRAGRVGAGVDSTATILNSTNSGDTGNKNALGNKGGVGAVTLTTNQIASHAHTDSGHEHETTESAHTHTQPAHTHNNGLTDPNHSHANSLSDPQHAHSNYMKDTISLEAGSTQIRQIEDVGNYTGTLVGTLSASTGITISNASAATGMGISNAAATATNNSASTGLTINSGTANIGNTGGGASHPNLMPYMVFNYIIKV